MALHVPKAPGFAQMLKDGAKVGLLKPCFARIVLFFKAHAVTSQRCF